MAITTERIATIGDLVLRGLLVILGLLIIVPIAVISSSTGGRCLLYADRRAYGPDLVCSYPIAIATIFHLFFCVGKAVLVIVILRGVLSNDWLSHKVFLIACTVTDVIACFLTLVSGGIISHGFSVMCSEVFHPHADKCGDLDIFSTATNSFLKNYYQRLNIAEAGVWISWLFWILLILLDVFHLRKADLLSLPQLPFSLPGCPIGGRHEHAAGSDAATGNDNLDNEARAAMAIEQPRVAVTYNLSSQGGVRRGGGPGTPPPVRPVPPRPGPSSGQSVMTTKY